MERRTVLILSAAAAVVAAVASPTQASAWDRAYGCGYGPGYAYAPGYAYDGGPVGFAADVVGGAVGLAAAPFVALGAPAYRYDYAYGPGYGWDYPAPHAYGSADYGPGYAYAPGYAYGPRAIYDKADHSKHVAYYRHHARVYNREPPNSYQGGAPMANGAGQLPGERTQCRTGCD